MDAEEALEARLADARGFAVPAVLLVLVIVLAFVGAADMAAIYVSGTARGDLNATLAQQAADAGLRVAVYEYNSLAVDTEALFTQSNGAVNGMCFAGTSAGVGDPTTNGVDGSGNVKWCPPVTNDLGDGARYSYVISPATQTVGNPPGVCLLILCLTIGEKGSTITRTIVSTGTAGAETRSVEEQVQMQGVSQLQCLVYLLGVCITLGPAIQHVSVTQYYTPVLGSYRQCSAVAAAVPSGQDPTSHC
jgi:hypothetical protein